MAPVARRPLHLGFIGQGTTSATKIASLLSDLIESAGGKAKVIVPATKAHWTEGIEAVADWAIENEIPLAIITDDTTASHKVLKNYITQASEKLKAANVATKIVDTVANGSGKMIFLWDDEDDDCYVALERCEAKSTEALDLTAGLHPLEFTGGDPAPEADAEPDAEAEPEADDWDAMDEDALQAQADEWGLDVTALDTWDDVRDALRAYENEGAEAEDGGVPTADEVLEWDFPTLKQYATDNGIEVPPRSRTSGYREAITAWLEAQGGGLEEPEDDEPLQLPEDDDALPMEVGEFDFTGVTEPITEAIAELRTDISALASSIADLAGLIGELNTPPPAPKAAPARAAAPRKAVAAPVKAAAKRTVSRPAPKAAPVEEPAERPLDAFMHLLGKKLTKAQATAIMVANAQKGRGRPTEDERKLVAQAKALVPQV